jgi:hypothetical protein
LSALADYAYESRDDQMTDVTLTETGANGSVISTMSGTGRDPNAMQTHGFNLQTGLFLLPKRLEIAGRYARFNPEGSNNRMEEARGAEFSSSRTTSSCRPTPVRSRAGERWRSSAIRSAGAGAAHFLISNPSRMKGEHVMKVV